MSQGVGVRNLFIRPLVPRNSKAGLTRRLPLENRFFATTPLLPPTILYTDNHLLVVNKPVGWHSIPNTDNVEDTVVRNSQKCFLSLAKSNTWGGGSKMDYLLPLHRLDQPCSGVLILGKTKKAATRVTKLWKTKGVTKDYLCVVHSKWLPRLQDASYPAHEVNKHDKTDVPPDNPENRNGWYHLRGLMQPHESRSVLIRPETPSVSSLSVSSFSFRDRPVHILWKKLLLHHHDDDDDDRKNNNPLFSLLQVQTTQGARHMVRALLAQIGKCPIVGDLRYSSSTSKSAVLLPDQSVALHAYRVTLDDTRLQLGSLNQFVFEAPIPSTWKSFFNISGPGSIP
jgi:23S rRNA-/tRNA-specific pseudouridylate synthase